MDSAEYVQRVLDAYRTTPGTCGLVRKPDRAFALALHSRGVPLAAVENAFVLAAVRRLARKPDAPPLGIIRSWLTSVRSSTKSWSLPLGQTTTAISASVCPTGSPPSAPANNSGHACGVDANAAPRNNNPTRLTAWMMLPAPSARSP